jgi:uncharacterized protein (TIGR02284 family)
MTTSDDRALSLLHGLLQLCRESVAGYETAEREVPDAKLWREFEPFRKQRMGMVEELEQRIRDLRGDPDTAPSGVAALHRAWLSLRAEADPSPNRGVLAEVERAESLLAQAYAQGTKEHDIDASTRRLTERHYELAQTAASRIRQLLERASPVAG